MGFFDKFKTKESPLEMARRLEKKKQKLARKRGASIFTFGTARRKSKKLGSVGLKTLRGR